MHAGSATLAVDSELLSLCRCLLAPDPLSSSVPTLPFSALHTPSSLIFPLAGGHPPFAGLPFARTHSPHRHPPVELLYLVALVVPSAVPSPLLTFPFPTLLFSRPPSSPPCKRSAYPFGAFRCSSSLPSPSPPFIVATLSLLAPSVASLPFPRSPCGPECRCRQVPSPLPPLALLTTRHPHIPCFAAFSNFVLYTLFPIDSA